MVFIQASGQLFRTAEKGAVAAIDLVGLEAERSFTTSRIQAAGKKRSSRHSRYRVGTSGQRASGHGCAIGALD